MITGVKNLKKIITILIILVLAAGGGGFYYWLNQKNSSAVQFKTEAVERGAITSQVMATGTVNPVTLVQVGSQVSGSIIKLLADFNTQVRKGQVIAQIDPALSQAKVDQGKADLKYAEVAVDREKTNLAENLRTLKRYQTLLKNQLISQMEVDTTQTKVDLSQEAIRAAKAQIEQARANLATAQTNLNYTTIRSPVDGIVVARNVDVGQTVAASLQAPTLFTIAQDLREMEVHTNVDEADIGRIKTGQEAKFTVDAYPGETFTAKVLQIRNAPSTIQNVVTYDVVLRLKNPHLKLKPGMTANVSIIIEEKENVLKVPNAALRFKPPQTAKTRPPQGTRPTQEGRKTGPGQVVWVLGPQKNPVRVGVQTGISDGQYTEIVQGKLKEGDPVIIESTAAGKAKGTRQQNQTSTPARGPRL